MGQSPQTPEVYPLWKYPVKMKKCSNISVTALHRFIPQPASGRSSELSLLSFCPCLAASLVWSEFWRLLRLHGLIFRTILCVGKQPIFPSHNKRPNSIFSSIVVYGNIRRFKKSVKIFLFIQSIAYRLGQLCPR